MQLVEQHVISKSNPRFALIDRITFASKNLYNATLYEIRQHFIFTGKYLSYKQMDKIMRKAVLNDFLGNGIGDVNGMLVSLIVHPERIVVPLRTRVHGDICH
jgi:hypothetical protein